MATKTYQQDARPMWSRRYEDESGKGMWLHGLRVYSWLVVASMVLRAVL